MIRDAKPEDFDALFTFVTEIPQFNDVFADYKLSSVIRTFARCVEFGYAKVVEHDGEIVGAMFGIIQENYWGARCAFDILNYSTRQTPQLLRLFSLWANENGAKDVFIGNTFGSKRYGQLIKRLGFTTNTQVYSRRF